MEIMWKEWKQMKEEMEEVKKEIRKSTERVEKQEKRKGETVAEGSTPTANPKETRENDGKEEVKEEGKGNQEEAEKEKRKRNIVIKGARVGDEGWQEKSRRIINEAAGREVEIKKEWERGNGRGGRIWFVKVKHEEDKTRIMKNKKVTERKERIGIDRDLTYEERGVRWWVREKEREMRRQGKEVIVGGKHKDRRLVVEARYRHEGMEEGRRERAE